MSEERKNIIRDVTTRIDKLPEELIIPTRKKAREERKMSEVDAYIKENG